MLEKKKKKFPGGGHLSPLPPSPAKYSPVFGVHWVNIGKNKKEQDLLIGGLTVKTSTNMVQFDVQSEYHMSTQVRASLGTWVYL